MSLALRLPLPLPSPTTLPVARRLSRLELATLASTLGSSGVLGYVVATSVQAPLAGIVFGGIGLALAGLVALGRRWTPVLGTVFALVASVQNVRVPRARTAARRAGCRRCAPSWRAWPSAACCWRACLGPPGHRASAGARWRHCPP